MNKEKLFYVLLAELVLASVLMIPQVFAVPVSAISVVPSTISWEKDGHKINDTFTVDIVANNCTDLWSWSVGVKWNASVLDYVSFTWGDFLTLSGGGLQIGGTVNHATGETTIAWSQTTTTNAVTAPSVKLLTFTFKAVGLGTSNITFKGDPFTKVVDKSLVTYKPPAFTLNHGSFSFTAPPPPPPISAMSVSPSTISWKQDGHKINDTFTVDIMANNCTDLWSWSVGVEWNASVLDYVSFTWGEFSTLSAGSLQIAGIVNHTTGETTSGWSETSTAHSVNATSVKLLTFTFKAVDFGTSNITIMGDPFTKVVDNNLVAFVPPAFILNHGNFTFSAVFLPVHNIDSGKDYATIQEAIDAGETLSGHTIEVDAGTYYEHVVVNKSLTLIGEDKGNTVIDGSGTGKVIAVSENNVYVSGFTIRNGSIGVWVNNSNGTTITDNDVSSNGFGIDLAHSSGCIITANTVSNNRVQGIRLDGSGGSVVEDNNMTCNKYNFGVFGTKLQDFIQEIGVSNIVDGKTVYYLINESGIIIDPSTFPDIGYLGIVNSTNISVKDLNMTKNVSGIMLAFSRDSILQNVTVSNNEYGVSFRYSNNITIVDSTIAHNDEGVYLLSSSDCVISGNTIANNFDGVYPHASNNNTIIANTLEDNTWGIYFDGIPVFGNKIYHNKFIHNSYGGFIVGSMNAWDDGYPSGGNFWSDYTGTDWYSGLGQNETGSDGLGDTPYTLDANNVDRYPLMSAFEVRSVSWGTKAYPIGLFSNSTVSEISFDQEGKKVYFNVTGPTGTTGFCRVAIPKTLMWCDSGHPEQWNVTVDGSPPIYLEVLEDDDYTYLYFVYSQSSRDVIVTGKYVVPEFSTWISMFLVFTVVSVIVALYKRKLPSMINHNTLCDEKNK